MEEPISYGNPMYNGKCRNCGQIICICECRIFTGTKRYLPNSLQKSVKVGDTLYFDLGTTQHKATVQQDEVAFFINKEDEHFIKCKDYRLNQSFYLT